MIQRTTLSADASDLATLRAEARRRGVSMARVLQEVVAEGAAARRAARPKPHWGIFDGGSDLAQACADDEAGPAPFSPLTAATSRWSDPGTARR